MVDIDRTPTGFAGPALPLGFHERTDAVFFDCSKVVEHTHVVLRAIPPIQLFQPPARETAAVVAIPVLYVLACRDGAVTIAQSVWCVTATAMVFLPEIGRAYGTVHTAGRDKGGPERVLCRHVWG